MRFYSFKAKSACRRFTASQNTGSSSFLSYFIHFFPIHSFTSTCYSVVTRTREPIPTVCLKLNIHNVFHQIKHLPRTLRITRSSLALSNRGNPRNASIFPPLLPVKCQTQKELPPPSHTLLSASPPSHLPPPPPAAPIRQVYECFPKGQPIQTHTHTHTLTGLTDVWGLVEGV